MYNKKIDNFDVCTICNISINNTADNIVKNNIIMETDTIVINYPNSHFLTVDSKQCIGLTEQLSLTEYNVKDKKDKKDKQDKQDIIKRINSSDRDYDVELLDIIIDEGFDNNYDNDFNDYLNKIFELDESEKFSSSKSDKKYKEGVVSESDIDTTFSRPICKSSSCIGLNEYAKDDELDELEEYILLSERTNSNSTSVQTVSLDPDFLIKHEEMCKQFYERDEDLVNKKCVDYSNECFCHYCRNYEVLPDVEVHNFLNKYLILNTNINVKYLILVFRLRPDIFSNYDIMMNKYLKKYILSYLNIKDENSNNIFMKNSEESLFKNTEILSFMRASNSINEHTFENLFHQSNLKYTDYIKCDSCKNYMCPKHIYLSNCYYAKCKICNVKSWTICGWCKPGFNEVYACKYLHNK